MKKFLVLLLFVVFPFGQLLRWDVGNGVTFQLNDFVVALVVLFSVRDFKKDKLFWPLVLWIGAMAISIVANLYRLTGREIIVAIMYFGRWVAYAGLYYALAGVDRKYLLWGILAVAIVGIGQFIFMPDVSWLAVSNWDDHYYRLVSTFLDPGFTGAILVAGLMIACESMRIKNEFLRITTLIILYVAMALTYSRATYLMYLVGFGVIGWYKKSVKIFLIAALVLAVTIPLLPKSTGEGTKLNRENSVIARVENWKQSITIWAKYPIFGVGYGAYNSVSKAKLDSHSRAGADSSLLLVLATTGIIGFVSYLWLIGRIWIIGKRNTIFVAIFCGVLVHSWFNNTLFYPWAMECLWIILAVSVERRADS